MRAARRCPDRRWTAPHRRPPIALGRIARCRWRSEIVEKHHNQKIDAPSGTALAIADAINEVSDNRYNYVYDRSQVREKRTVDEIGIHAVRGGNIVGEHEVMFAGKDEIIEINHRAMSKEIFAVGAVKAAKYLAGKPAGFYTMKDVLKDILE